MKILDKYLLKTFLKTFTTVFVILFFIFVLQSIWLFINELAGKDLDFMMIMKFLLFSMPRIIPLVLPLTILLASIMTFGSLAENYEFAAMKSSGISLQRAMRSLTIFIFILSIVAFSFANNVIPYAEYKFLNFRKNIAQVQPAMAIAEGQFSDVGTYNIKVNKKSGENGTNLSGVTIHRKSTLGEGNLNVIKAKSGKLISSEQSSNLQLVLFDGFYYEDIIPKKYEDRSKLPFAKSAFKKYIINIDLSKLNKVDINDESITNTNTMLNVNELKYTLDSLNKNMKSEIKVFAQTNFQRLGNNNNNNNLQVDLTKRKLDPKDFLEIFGDTEKKQIYENAIRMNESNLVAIEASKNDLLNKQKNINEHYIVLYDKFVIAYACFLMFFIGAPLGAIIRKGGMGLPIVFAILIFITFHFLNTFGRRIAQEDGMLPFFGAAIGSLILTPFALMLTMRATNDKEMINIDSFFEPIIKFFKKIPKLKIIPNLKRK